MHILFYYLFIYLFYAGPILIALFITEMVLLYNYIFYVVYVKELMIVFGHTTGLILILFSY